jgi:phage terminase large subunit-like protein
VIQGETIKIDRVISLLERFYSRYQVKALAYDPWQLKELQARFLKLHRLTIETPQYGKVLSPLILEFERKVLETTFSHQANPVLDFCLENFQVKESKYGKLEFDKSDARSKIDLACSTVVALNALPEIGRAVNWNLPPVM